MVPLPKRGRPNNEMQLTKRTEAGRVPRLAVFI
jgi:hypothetical protein